MMPSLKRRKLMSIQECHAALQSVESTLNAANRALAEARSVGEPAGVSFEGSGAAGGGGLVATDPSYGSNTDHVILQTGDEVTDRIEELKRRYLVRRRKALPEARGEGRWDKPKKAGERRRRIVREADLPEAPPVPPPAAYVIFVCQVRGRGGKIYTRRTEDDVCAGIDRSLMTALTLLFPIFLCR
jgi:hypothetical protein